MLRILQIFSIIGSVYQNIIFIWREYFWYIISPIW